MQVKSFNLYNRIGFSKILISLLLILVSNIAFTQFRVVVNTTANPPFNPLIEDYILSGSIKSVFNPNTQAAVYAIGKIEKLSAPTFSITGNGMNYTGGTVAFPRIHLSPNIPYPLTQTQMLGGFGNFDPRYIEVEGIDLNSIREGNKLKLPPGSYRICFMPWDPDLGIISAPGSGCALFTIASPSPGNAVIINTQIIPPANPDLLPFIARGGVRPRLQYNNPQGAQSNFKIYGKLESMSPKSFSISLNPDYISQPSVTLSPGVAVQMMPQQVMDAFGNFNESSLLFEGISPQELRDERNTWKLPEGNYRICFYARYDYGGGEVGGYASNVNLGCANFNICYKAAAPQFTQPLTNFRISDVIQSVKPASPVIFGWTPPQATCGIALSRLTYDFEIREMFDGQTPTDAINNPPVYQKRNLSTSTFVFDTILNKQVLQRGKMYAIRVKANTPSNAEIEIENQGYSRVEAFVYGEKSDNIITDQKPDANQKSSTTNIPTSKLKGKVVWSFKKSEEDMAPQIDNPDGLLNILKNKPVYIEDKPKDEKKSAAMQAMDPNFKVAAIQISLASIAIVNTVRVTDLASRREVMAFVTGDGKVIEKTNLGLPSQKGKNIYPLKEAKVRLMGVRSSTPSGITDLSATNITASANLSRQLGIVSASVQNQAIRTQNTAVLTIPGNYQIKEEKDQTEDLLASGQTSADGSFEIRFIDPKFKNISKYSRMRLIIEHQDFEGYSDYLPIVSPEEIGDIDLGEIQLVAKTYRFTPYVSKTNSGLMNLITGSAAHIELYYPADAIERNPHYAQMARENASKTTKNIAGKKYALVADLQNGETINKLFYQTGADNFMIRISEKNKEDYYSYAGVSPSVYSLIGAQTAGGKPVHVDESEFVISVKTEYKLNKQLPYIYGDLKISLGDAGFDYGEGSVVTVSFDKNKVVEKYQGIEIKGASGNQPVRAASAPTGQNQSAAPSARASNTAQPSLANQARATTQMAAPMHTAGPLQALNTEGGGLQLSTKVNTELVNIAVLSMYQSVVDSDGNFRIDNLPVLADGNYFTVTVKTKDGLPQSLETGVTLKRGDSANAAFQINPDLYTVTGLVVDENNQPLSGATLQWKSGGAIMETDSKGLFLATNYKDDSLSISTFGFLKKTIFVKLDKTKKEEQPKKTEAPKKTKKENKKNTAVKTENLVVSHAITDYSATKMTTWSDQLLQQPSVKNTFQNNSSTIAGYTLGNMETSSALTAVYRDLFSPFANPAGIQDLGRIRMERGSSKVNFVVKDEDGKAVERAVVQIEPTVDTFTDKTGQVLLKGDGSQFVYTITGPEGSGLVPFMGEVPAKEPDGTVATVNVILKKGIKLSGKITSGSKNLEDAEISVKDMGHIKATSKNDGTYELYVPRGFNTIVASKKGYYGKSTDRNITAATTLNFDLEDNGGRNISTLLGFEIVLESHKKEGTSEIWSGAFVNLKGNSLFAAPGSARLAFSNVKVTFDKNGNAVPDKNEVKTDATELAMKLYGYIPLKVKGSPVITVKSAGGKGTIGGKLQLDLDQISSLGGLALDKSIKPMLLPLNSSIDQDVPIFVSDGTEAISELGFSFARSELKNAADKALQDLKKKADKATGEAKKALDAKLNELKTATASAGSYTTSGNIPSSLPQYITASVFGFDATIDLSKSKISNGGIDLNGFLITPHVPVISSLLLDIERLKIGTDFSVRDVSVNTKTNIKFEVASWKAEMNAASFNRNGFKIGGKISIQIPQSKQTDLQFSNLTIGTSGLYGGSFTLPNEGLDLFEIVRLKTGSTPLTFGQVGNTGVYKLGGSASFAFKKLFTEKIDLPYFQVQTDGKFGATVPVNKSLNAGFAKFALNSIGFNTTKALPQIDIGGKFSVDVKMLSFKTSGIHFTRSGVTAERITLAVDIPAVNVEAFVDMKDNGFEGGGSLSILNTPVKAGISFFYFKEKTGTRLGADFSANVKITLGPVIISRVGGGFTYSPNSDYFRVTISGGASVTGLETLVALDPIELTVESGPKITGKAGVKVASTLEVANAFIVLDIPNSYFTIGIRSNLSPLPDLMKTNLQGDLVVSTKTGDTYFFLGAGMDVNLLNLISSRGVYALGFGVKNAQSRETISYYMSDAPAEYLSDGSFTGIYVRGNSYMGNPRERAVTLDLGIVWGEAWFEAGSDFYLIANFNNLNFRISSSMYYSGGISGCVGVRVMGKKIAACASARASACVSIAGGYNNSLGWNFDASAAGEGELSIGHDCDCNSICYGAFYAGGKICVGLGARISYASRQGGLREFSIHTGNRVKCQ